MKQHCTPIVILLGLMALCATTGCSLGKGDGWRFAKLPSPKSWDVRRAVGLKKNEPVPVQTPTRLVSTWQETTLNQQGEKPQRGFGGRLLFFNEGSDDTIRVDGQLVVYAYDDTGREAHETHPTRRYIFPAEQFVRHESESQVGPSYSVWLPWDAVGGEQKNISLIARFEPKVGPLVVGEQTRHLLPGMRRLATGEAAPATEPVSDIRLTQYSEESKLTAPEMTNKRPQAVSIALARKNWEQRLQTPQNRQTHTSTAAERATVLPGPAR